MKKSNIPMSLIVGFLCLLEYNLLSYKICKCTAQKCNMTIIGKCAEN